MNESISGSMGVSLFIGSMLLLQLHQENPFNRSDFLFEAALNQAVTNIKQNEIDLGHLFPHIDRKI